MKVLVLFGSPRKNGNTSKLVKGFVEGVQASGNEVEVLDVAKLHISPCVNCNYCMSHNGQCVQKDDNDKVREAVLSADVVCFASPIYYYGLSAQLKLAIDRFYAYNATLLEAHKKCALLITYADDVETTAEPTVAHYRAFTKYLGWNDCGVVAAMNCFAPDDVNKGDGEARAYALGKSICAD